MGRELTAHRPRLIAAVQDRPEGVRIKHRVGFNSVKLYDKQGSVLRAETTINAPYDFRVWRRTEGNGKSPRAWHPMRKGVADLHRRAQVSQASNDRYLDALAAADTSTPFGHLVAEICRPAFWHDKRVRALKPWSDQDMQLFRIVTRGEFNVNGFRNRDIQALLYDHPAQTPEEGRRRSARVTRLLRLLRAHGLIKKVQHTHRYALTDKGRLILPAILTADRVTLTQLNAAPSPAAVSS